MEAGTRLATETVGQTDEQTREQVTFAQAYIGPTIENVRRNTRFMGAPEHAIIFEALSRLGNSKVLRTALETKMATNRALRTETRNWQTFEYEMQLQALDEIYPEWVNLARQEQVAN